MSTLTVAMVKVCLSIRHLVAHVPPQSVPLGPLPCGVYVADMSMGSSGQLGGLCVGGITREAPASGSGPPLPGVWVAMAINA